MLYDLTVHFDPGLGVHFHRNLQNSELRFNFDTNNLGKIETINIYPEPSVNPIAFKRQADNRKLEK